MFRITDIGTDISAHLSMIAAVIPFSLFTAYQFLSANRCFDAPKSKIRSSPSCVYRRLAPWWWIWSRRGFFFVYCVSNFEFRFYFKTALTTAWRRATIQHLRRKEWCSSLLRPHSLTMLFAPRWPHSYRRFLPSRPHAAVGVFLSCFLCSSSLP